MPIIINEFEIVPPAASANGGGAAQAQERGRPAESAAGASLQPADVEEIIRHSLQRWLRVWAD